MATLKIVEVGPRDGLQNESRTLTTAEKLGYIGLLEDAGLTRIESASFARPDRVPQMADSDEIAREVAARPAHHSGLVMNRRGYERARHSRLREINLVVVATETFSQRNQGMSVDASVAMAAEIASLAEADGISATLTVGASFGCPFEGETPVAAVISVVEAMLGTGIAEICLADTIGVGVPAQVRELSRQVRSLSPLPLRFHFHDTRNTAIANAAAAIEDGDVALDASAGGIGGCPFAPAATGNLATEDLLYLAERSGLATGIDFDGVIRAAEFIWQALGRTAATSLARAGWFPAR